MMKLRNILRMKDNSSEDDMIRMNEYLNSGGDTILINQDITHEKVEISTKDLILDNMRLIEKMIDLEKEQSKYMVRTSK